MATVMMMMIWRQTELDDVRAYRSIPATFHVFEPVSTGAITHAAYDIIILIIFKIVITIDIITQHAAM